MLTDVHQRVKMNTCSFTVCIYVLSPMPHVQGLFSVSKNQKMLTNVHQGDIIYIVYSTVL